MAKSVFPSDRAERFLIRFPEGMRDQIAEAAKTSGRSMNAEIIARLSSTFENATFPTLDEDAVRGIAIDTFRTIYPIEWKKFFLESLGLQKKEEDAAQSGKKPTDDPAAG